MSTFFSQGQFFVFIVWAMMSPEPGVKTGNQMDRYALDYIEENNILQPSEKILAYYDNTLSMNSSDAFIVTSERVIHHKQGRNTDIAMEDIEKVEHSSEGFGYMIEVYARSGEIMKIEIPPLNDGETFVNILNNALERRQ